MGHVCPTYKESFQVRWDNSIPLFLHAAIYLEVPLFRWTSQNAFSHVQMILCAMLLCSIAHSIICTWPFRGKMHSDWFNGIEILQGRWEHGEKVGYCYRSGLEKTPCKWDIYVPLVTKGLILFFFCQYSARTKFWFAIYCYFPKTRIVWVSVIITDTHATYFLQTLMLDFV